MTQQELDTIIEKHQHWLKMDCEGWESMRANLSGADFRGANFRGTNLSGADFRGADLSGADFRGADLSGANLSGANFRGADFRGANFRGTNLSGADFRGANLSGANFRGTDLSGADFRRANLSGADFRGADLSGANFRGADLSGADLDDSEKFRLGQILKEPITGYKKTDEGVVITAEIPAGAIVFCINGKKCRTNRAKITDMDGKEILHSQHDNGFEYTLGQEIVIDDFCLMYNVECASGFHFFRTREEAENY